MRIQIRKEGGRWRDAPSSQWDLAVWAVATELALSCAEAAERLRAGWCPYVPDFGGVYVRGVA